MRKGTSLKCDWAVSVDKLAEAACWCTEAECTVSDPVTHPSAITHWISCKSVKQLPWTSFSQLQDKELMHSVYKRLCNRCVVITWAIMCILSFWEDIAHGLFTGKCLNTFPWCQMLAFTFSISFSWDKAHCNTSLISVLNLFIEC